MLRIDLPKEPIDRYKVQFYRLSLSEHWCYINKIEAVYYLNTSWDTYRPNDRGGADLVDDWMLSKEGSPEGRIERWEGIFCIEDDKDVFQTKNAAIKEAARRMGDIIAREKLHLEALISRRGNLRLE